MNVRLRSNLYLWLIGLLWGTFLNAQVPFTVQDDPVPADVEKMYRRGLDWLMKTQRADGTWSDSNGSQPGVVGLAVIAFLAHGDDPNSGIYSIPVKRGISFILSQQDASSGFIQSSMYNHGLATLALAEAYGHLDNPQIGPALDKAVKLLLKSQAGNPTNAWRYQAVSRDGDTTVSGACLVALLAARNAGIEIPETAIAKALDYYKSCQTIDGGFGYTTPSSASPATSAIGTLVFALARKKDTPAYKAAIRYLGDGHLSDQYRYFYYYLYYASQAMFHSTPEKWIAWNQRNIQQLKASQLGDGSWQGAHGNTFSTSCALLSLALNYRLLPIYER